MPGFRGQGPVPALPSCRRRHVSPAVIGARRCPAPRPPFRIPCPAPWPVAAIEEDAVPAPAECSTEENMPRRREVPKRVILPDPVYHNEEVAKFINVLMLSGKKAVAERILYGAFEIIKGKSGKDPIEVFQVALSNSRPMVEVKSRRVGGANYQVPVEVRPVRRTALAMRWLREAAKKRSEKSMGQRLANELMEAAENRGGAVKRRDEVHRMAEANRAFSHFRF